MISRQLLQRARKSLDGSRRQKSVELRRAISDAYYALFHAIARSNADALIVSTRRASQPWSNFYRALNHGQAKDAFKKKGKDVNFASISTAFIDLQAARHTADYDPNNVYKRRADVEALIVLAENAILEIDALNSNKMKEMAAFLLTKDRA